MEEKNSSFTFWYLGINIIFILMIIYGIYYNNILISILAYILMIAHLCKEWFQFEKWPYWTEYCALIIGVLLIYSGYKSKSIIVSLLGLIIIMGHSRQLIYDDDLYYFLN